jgi:hypothetical protein
MRWSTPRTLAGVVITDIIAIFADSPYHIDQGSVHIDFIMNTNIVMGLLCFVHQIPGENRWRIAVREVSSRRKCRTKRQSPLSGRLPINEKREGK